MKIAFIGTHGVGKTTLCYDLALAAQAPTGTISGRVINSETKEPLLGANITIGGRTAITNADGRYTVTNVPAGTDALRVRLLGYAPATQSVTVQAGKTSTVDVALTPMAVSLAEIVVTGYGAQVAGNITGAVSTVSAEEFNPGRIVSAAQLISGKAPGVQVIDNNEPGGGLSIRIRGSTSCTASSDPLYVIDGINRRRGSAHRVGPPRQARARTLPAARSRDPPRSAAPR